MKFIIKLMICFSLVAPVAVLASQAPPFGAMVHFSIPVKDGKASTNFYGKLFGWKFNELFPGAYLIDMPGDVKGGLAESEDEDIGKGVVIYIHVENINQTLNAAKLLGASDLQGPFKFPGGQYATFLDIDGNKIGLSQFDKKGEQ